MRTRNPHAIAHIKYRTPCLSDPAENLRHRFPAHLPGKNLTLFSLSCLILRLHGKQSRIPGPSAPPGLIILRVKTGQLIRLNKRPLHIQRNIQPARPRPSRLRQIQCLFHTVTDTLRQDHHLTVLGHAGNRLADIKFLISHRPDSHTRPACRRIVAHLPGENQHRDRIQPPPHNAGNRIRPAWPGRHTEGSHPVMNPCIRFCGNGACLFMMIIDTV